ncbi:hypothetical protein [Ruegeria atlantica]|uniref:hypothetical protein n=1 Tax=Ruegeria atlantica TaxID=81569 RepID=UPI0014813220|nr:hypothetical protein [Ruegeria atlantica]
MKSKLLLLAFGLAIMPAVAVSESYKETFECTFGRGIANKPTPTHLVFSIDEFGRSVLLHDVVIPNVTSGKGSGRIKSDTPQKLSIAWVGSNYVFTDSGRSYASNESRIDALDLRDQEFSVFLNRNTMKAMAKSSSNSAYLPRDGFARGRCESIAAPTK